MQRYDTYKDSGVKWLGEIPSHWEVIKSKYLWKESFSISENGNEELLSVSQYDGITPAKGDSRSESLKGYKIVSENDLVINIMLAWMGGLGVSKFDGIVSPAYCVYKLTKDSNPKYLHYLYKIPLYLAEFARHSTGVIPSRWRMYTDDFGQVVSLLPPRKEQDAIVEYLDEKMAKIDAAIAQQQKMIDLLNERKQIIINRAVTKGLNPNAKMKDSGVEWIGEVPEGWNCRRLRFIGEANNGLTYSPLDMVDEGNGILVLRSSNIKDGKLVFEDNVYVKDVPQKLMVQKDDIIICSRNGSASLVGKCAIVEDELQASFGAFMMRFRSKYNSKYVYYLLTAAISHYKQLFATSTINQLTLGIFADIKMSITLDEDEQKCIAEKLDLICGKLDTYIGICNKQISLLQERKQIIINEVVTGKVKVTN
jgi:type I restriction enzyme S subunit